MPAPLAIFPKLLLLPVLVLASAGAALGCEGRPRVGLALGGGGARGIAHIGVLRWLSEHRVPVDFIAGTSMGGLVGGAAATGLSPDDIEALITSVDWNLTFLGDTPYPLKDFRRKEDRRQFQVALELGLKGGFHLPNSLDPGHQVGLLLSRLSFPYSTVSGFDELPTPVRFLAVDIESGDKLVLGDGSLGRALRATMAIPGVFSPVEIDGRLLVDGGLLNNVPADVVSEHADVVVAVDVGAELLDRSRLSSALTQLLQSVDIMIADNTREVLKKADIVVRPTFEGISSSDWRKGADIVALGYRAAECQAQELLSYALDETEWAAYQSARRARFRESELTPSFIEVRGVNGREERAIRARLRDYRRAPLMLDRLERDLTALTGSGRYQSLSYEALARGEEVGLLVRVNPKDYGPPFIRLSLDINNEASDVDFNFGTRITAFDWGGDGAELRTDIVIGSQLGIAAELYRPIASSRWFLAPRAVARNDRERFYDEGVLAASFDADRFGGGLDLGLALGTKSELRAGYDFNRRDFRLSAGQSALDNEGGTESVARVKWLFDGQDRSIIPTRGLRTLLFSEWFFEAPTTVTTDKDFGKAELDTSLFLSLGQRNRVFFRGALGSSLGGDPPPFYQFTLGGPFRLGAFALDGFRGDRFFLASAGYLRSLGRLPDFVGQEIYVGSWLESGSAYYQGESMEIHGSVTGGLVMETALGPFFFGASLGDDGSAKLHFALGRLVGLGRLDR